MLEHCYALKGDNEGMEIRRERSGDRAAVRAVHRAAFARAGYHHHDDVPEAILVDQLRGSPWWLAHLSLVAVSDTDVVGHVIASRAVIEPGSAPALGLGPLGVAPGWQGRGVGSALMHAVIGAAEARGETLIGLLGEPDYYARFGFRSAATAGVQPPDPAWGSAFQVRVLSAPAPTGMFRYAPLFDALS